MKYIFLTWVMYYTRPEYESRYLYNVFDTRKEANAGRKNMNSICNMNGWMAEDSGVIRIPDVSATMREKTMDATKRLKNEQRGAYT